MTLRDVEKTLGIKVFATLANDYEAAITSINSGKPLVTTVGKTAVARDLRALAEKLTGQKAPAAPAAPARTGLFGKLGTAIRGGRPATDTGN